VLYARQNKTLLLLRTSLNFEDKDTKELLSKLDFNFFLKQNIEEEKYRQDEVDTLYNSYKDSLKDLKKKYKKDKKQANYFLEGQVRKMFTGGFLPALFHLDEGRQHTIIAFQEIGEDLAYFKLWQDYYKRKVTAKKVWDFVVKVGSVLAIILSLIKLWETFFKK
jgi:hypothetical protein